MAANPVNTFGQQLLAEWRPNHVNESLVFSPLSIAVCFLLVYNGARGKTKKELETLFDYADESVEAGLLSKLENYTGDSVAKMANRLYVEQSLPLNDDFVMNIGSMNVESSDFMNAAEDAREAINTWVSDRTVGLIPDLVPSGAMSSATLFVAVNALYFKGRWLMQFPADQTENDVFHSVDGNQTAPFMMLRDESFRVKEVTELDSVLFGMPYEGDQFTMHILLPNDVDGWKNAEESLPNQIGSLFNGGFVERTVDVLKVPKWEMELLIEELSQILVNLGLSTIFSSDANFKGITPNQELSVSEVIHKAKIVVDEEGTEAAAATAFVFRSASLREPFNIVVDRPFLYFIVDETDGTILFQGTQTRIQQAEI